MIILILLLCVLAGWSQFHFRAGMSVYSLLHAIPAGNQAALKGLHRKLGDPLAHPCPHVASGSAEHSRAWLFMIGPGWQWLAANIPQTAGPLHADTSWLLSLHCPSAR